MDLDELDELTIYNIKLEQLLKEADILNVNNTIKIAKQEIIIKKLEKRLYEIEKDYVIFMIDQLIKENNGKLSTNKKECIRNIGNRKYIYI